MMTSDRGEKNSASRWSEAVPIQVKSHKPPVLFGSCLAFLLCKLGIMMLPLRIHLCYWGARLGVDVKDHYVIICDPQASSLICSMSKAVFPHPAAQWKLERQYAIIIVTVNPFAACHISWFTYLTKHVIDVMRLCCTCILKLSHKWESQIGSP